jgi:hypothetical protein
VKRIIYIVRFAIGEFLFDLAHWVHPDWTYHCTARGVVTGQTERSEK